MGITEKKDANFDSFGFAIFDCVFCILECLWLERVFFFGHISRDDLCSCWIAYIAIDIIYLGLDNREGRGMCYRNMAEEFRVSCPKKIHSPLSLVPHLPRYRLTTRTGQLTLPVRDLELHARE